tara:strand:+ start:168 stop:593 length:426 start_codon:yes stop_codon:yes gene_type:complete
MTFYRGEEGSVKFKNATGTAETIVSTTGWSFSGTRETLDCTHHGATQRQYTPGLFTATGSIDFLYTAGSGETDNLLQEVIAGNGEDAEFELYFNDSNKIAFNGIITSMDTGTSIGDLTSISCSFQASMSDPSTAATGVVIS